MTLNCLFLVSEVVFLFILYHKSNHVCLFFKTNFKST